MASAHITLSLDTKEAEIVATAIERYLVDVRFRSSAGTLAHEDNAVLRNDLESIKRELEKLGFWGA
jgi:hypothetical protein